jgi:hypothetical protein
MNLGKYKLTSYTNSQATIDGEQVEVRSMNFTPVTTAPPGPMGIPSTGNITVGVTDQATWPEFVVGEEYTLTMGAAAVKAPRK